MRKELIGIYRILIVVLLAFGFFVVSKPKPSYAIICASGYYCTSTTQNTGPSWWRQGYIDSSGNVQKGGCWTRDYYTCSGDDNDCRAHWLYRYDGYGDCQADNNASGPLGCCLEDQGCDPSCGSCSSGSRTDPGNSYVSATVNCTREDCTTYSANCYSSCPTISNCSSQGYVSSCPSGETCVDRTIDESSKCGGNSNCLSDCDTDRSCKLVCPKATCSDYDSGIPGVEFYDSCPTSDCRTADLSIEIEGEPNDCPHYTDKTCYTPNSPPEIPDNTDLSLQVKHSSEVTLATAIPYSNRNLLSKFINRIRAAGFDTETVMHYWSDTHSGREIAEYGLNNPVGLHAEYSDSDGQEDIVALYVWWSWRTNRANLILPNKLDTTGTLPARTNSEDNWGFLITRTDYNGTWDRVYVPNLNGANREWVDAGSVDETIRVKGPGTNRMVELSGINVRSVGADEVHVDLLMKFLTGSGNDIVAPDDYNLWALANDYVGFTAFETDGNIKDSANALWTDSNEDWALDMEPPVINIDTSDSTEGYVDLSMNITDELELAYVRVDACETGMIAAPSPITTTNGNPNNYNLLECNDANFMADIDITNDANLREQNPTELPNNSTLLNETLEIYLNTNDEGAITFWVTAIDKAGNLSQEQTIYRLGQWVAVENGFVYGGEGVSSSTRNLENDSWDNYAPLNESEIRTGQGFEEQYADLTDQVLLGGNLSTSSFLGFLEKVSENSSFKASDFRGVSLNAAYADLLRAYQTKKSNPTYTSLFIEETSTNLLGTGQDLTDICSGFDPSTEYCIVLSNSPITIQSGFTCNGRALIASSDDINISPDFENNVASDACILLSGGDINISEGDGKSGAPVNYDILKAFVIADGSINIASDSSDNGILVEGGLVAFGRQTSDPAIINNREILWGPRNLYPVIAINNVAKYGILSRTLFGSQIDIFKTEVGFKPY